MYQFDESEVTTQPFNLDSFVDLLIAQQDTASIDD